MMYTLNCKGRLLVVDRPIVMGIINITPDSFFEGSRSMRQDGIIEKAERFLKEGATILDIGGQSTRPGSYAVSEEEEMSRVVDAVSWIHKQYPAAILSVDTFFSSVAKASVEAGASMVNDISGGFLDEAMLETVAALGVPYICMHMRGTPQTMGTLNHYDNMLVEIMDYFIERIEACRKAGIKDIILDPGFGFAKNIRQNFFLLNNASFLNALSKPWLAGLSRKGTIYKTLDIPVEESLNGTTVLNTIALSKGASILRVHDVKEAMQAIELMEHVKSNLP